MLSGVYETVLRTAVPFYGRHLMRKHFDGLWVQGLDRAREVASRQPVIFAVNHVCWWDGILMLTLAPRLGVDNRFLVDADSVQKLSYLKQFGAIGIDRRTTVHMIEGMETAAGWLDRPGHSLWVYPQGRYRPSHIRPLGLQRGLTIVQKLSGAVVIPVTMQLDWFLAHLPACAVTFGEPLEGRDKLMDRLEAAMLAQLDELDAWFDGGVPGPPFTPEVATGIVPIEDGVASKVALSLQQGARRVRKRVLGA
ncbi:MAG: 1-acyl-sn-glycerol-3-phosphate acyltransferase [Alphaproteobacteria bacterium]|nr:1-acyl-sn-glycerol-3-phosphate acyltransferase [Alphaproteobacteria bacterium]